MKFGAIASCDITSLQTLLLLSDTTTCASESGYTITSLASPTGAEMAIMCTSTACQWVLTQLESLAPSECSLGTFYLYADLITPLKSYCSGSSTTATAGSSDFTIQQTSFISGSSGSSSSSSSSSTSGSSSTIDTAVSSSGSSSSANATASSPGSIASSSSSGSNFSGTIPSSSSASADSSATTSSASSSSMSVGAIVGIVAAVVVIIVVCVFFFVRRRKRRQSHVSSDALLESPVVGKMTRLLEHDHENTRTAGSSADSKPSTSTLWEDPVILSSRLPIDRIKLGTVISRGAFGEVYRGRYRDQTVAVKTLLPEKRKDMAHIEAFLSEVRLMATMDHPHIVQFIGVAWDSLSDLCCVTEFMAGGDLRSLLKNYQSNGVSQGLDTSKLQIAYQVAYALTYLHSLSPVVLHRDLKSRNILLTEALDAKITDFGASRIRSDATMTAGVGSSLWMAPEVMMGQRYGEKADVFSLGVVMAELDTHELPYSHAKESDSGYQLPDTAVLQMVLMGKLRVRFSPFMDPDMARFVESCVDMDPEARPKAAEVLYFLQLAMRKQ